MIHVNHGYRLQVSGATQHTHHFTDVADPIRRSIPSGANYNVFPAAGMTSAGSKIISWYGSSDASWLDQSSIDFVTTSDPNTVQTIGYQREIDEQGRDIYFLTWNGVVLRNIGRSYCEPLMILKSNDISARSDAQGNLYYVAVYPWFDCFWAYSGGSPFVNSNVGEIIRNNTIYLATTPVPQDEYLHTVAGS